MSTAVQLPGNPITRTVNHLPVRGLGWTLVATTLGATAFALWYAYDQDRLFPARHLPRTWSFVALFCGVGVLSLGALLARPGRATAFASAFGAGALVYGGANLLHTSAGSAVFALGVAAWASAAATNYRRGGGLGMSLAGLGAAWLMLMGLAVAIAAFIEN